jgi:myosin heavy subunit
MYSDNVNDDLPVDSGEEFPQETQTQEVDWKTEAIRAQARAEVLQQMQTQSRQSASPPAPRVSESDSLAQEVERLRAEMPALDPQNPNSFWDREKHKERLDETRHKLSEARERERRNAMMAVQYQTQSQTVVQNIKGKFSSRPAFQKIERQFDQMVSQLAPHVRADPNALTVMMKTLLFDAGDTGGAKAPPAPPSSGYAPNRAAPKRGGKAQFQTEQEAQVAAYYGMTAEEYYDPRYNENSPEAQGKGVSI